MAFNIGKQLLDIKADVKVQSIVLTPSVACKSSPDNVMVFTRLLECLHMKYSCGLECPHIWCPSDLLLAAKDGENSAECSWANHVHNWTAGLEASSYGPLVDYLKLTAHLNALAIPNGEGLPNRLLFDMNVFSLKKDTRVRSKLLRQTADEPRLMFRIKGRTDVVVIPPGGVYAIRVTVRIAIEVKPPGFKKSEALREAFL